MATEKPVLDVLVSAVVSVREAERTVRPLALALQAVLARCATDYEIILVDNASRDGTVPLLEELAQEIPNLQVYSLSARVDDDVARVAGLEQAIGDYVVLLDPYDDIGQIPAMLERAVAGHDLVLAVHEDARRRRAPGVSGLASRLFLRLYRAVAGYDLYEDAPRYRLMSRRVVNYVLQHDDAYINYQLVPLTGGFKTDRLVYAPSDDQPHKLTRTFRDAVRYAFSLLLFTSAVPLRLITLSCGLAAGFSVLYSLYVFLVYLLREDVAAGWTTLSLQISVLFFLLTVAVGILAEYMIHISRQVSRRPQYYISREFRSGQITRESRLNVLTGGEA